MVILKEITLMNFKSFKGETKVGIRLFTGIVGSNGAGKSNFIDAVSFALGVSTSNLRVSRLQELVYRSNSGEYEENMFVTMVLWSLDGAEMSFTRSYKENSCQYRINDNIVSHSDYMEAPRRLGINAKIKNFVVFQNSVESIVTTSPLKRTEIFEEISGSGCYLKEYKRLESQMAQMERELQFLYQNRRSISAELRQMLYCKQQAREYRTLEKKYDAARVNLLLFNLHCAERDIRQWSEATDETSAKIVALESEKYAAEEDLRAATKTCKKHKREAALMESNVKSMEMDVLKAVNDVMALEAKVKYAQNKVASCQESLESARKANEAREQCIGQLQEALRTIEEMKDEYARRYFLTLERDSQHQESLLEEYERLKALCLVNFTADHQQLMFLERKHKSVEDELEAATRKRDELQNAVDRKCALRLEILTRAIDLEKSTEEIKQELEKKRQHQRALHTSVLLSKAKECSLSEELEDITQQIGDFKIDEKIREKNQIVNDLKRLFPGVLDRLRNMCHPIHDRYNAAVTKVLARHLDSIVVETSETARLCIEHLKDQCIGTDTFLPLDNIAVDPIKQQLRAIGSPPNVKLVYDVINCDPRIGRAVQFVTSNTLVCETPEHAAEIAFATQKEKKHDCVSVDGTIFRKSGLISGGSRDLLTKAQRWDSSLKMKLLLRKGELIRALREIRRKFPKESELSTLESTVVHLERLLEYAYNDYRATAKQVADLEFEIQSLEDELDASTYEWDKVQLKVRQSLKRIDQFKSKILQKEKEFYADFCKKNGFDDIRHYEDGLKLSKEQMKNFHSQIDCIKEQLDFERARNTAKDVSRWERNLREAERVLESNLEQKRVKDNTLNDFKTRAHYSEMQYKSIQKSIEEVTNELKEFRSKVDTLSKEHMNLSKHINAMQILIEKKKDLRHSMLIDAKVHGLKIPLVNGPPNDSSDARDSPDRSSSISESDEVYEHENHTQYDFSKLPSKLTTLENRVEIHAARKDLEKSVSEIAAAIDNLADPDMKASQQAQMLKDELAKTKSGIERASKNLRKTTAEFARVKRDRYGKFMEFFEHAAEQVDIMYKKLTRSPSAQAFLLPENPEEPYLGGIHYHCIAPGKRYQWPSALSGGEKTLAALPLICAMHSGESPPFKVLDEIDTALDSKSTTKVMKYLNENKAVQQSIVISHKKEVFAGADALIGIVSVITDDSPESVILSIDLSCYKR